MKSHLVQQLHLESPPGLPYDNPLSLSKTHLSSAQAKQASWMGMWWESPPLRLSGTNLCSASRNAVLLSPPHCFPSRISSNGFYLAFPTILVLMPQVRELMWEFCQLLSMPIPIMHLELEKHHGMGLGTHWTHCEMGLSRTPLITWPLYAPTLTAGPLWYIRFLEISVNSEPVSNNIWKFWFFFFQNFSYPGEDHRSLWRRQGERLTVYIFGSVSDPSSRIPSLITINKKKTGKSIENQAK